MTGGKGERTGKGASGMRGIAAKVLLTGPPGCGKTTVARKVAGILGDQAAGFFTEEVRDAMGSRTGFRVESIDGRTGELSSKRAGPGPRVGAYVVNVRSFESVALPSLAGEADKVFLIDEIGKMECFSEAFRNRIREILESDFPLLATIPLRGGGSFLDGIRNRRDARIIVVTRENRDRLPEEIARMFGGILPCP